jgi:hypothetical protein
VMYTSLEIRERIFARSLGFICFDASRRRPSAPREMRSFI